MRAAYKNTGIFGLHDTLKGNSGRPSEKELPLEGKYERLKAQNIFLKEENELLKKLEMAERLLGKKKDYPEIRVFAVIPDPEALVKGWRKY